MLNVRLTPKGGRDTIDGIETLSDGRSILKALGRHGSNAWAVTGDGPRLVTALEKICAVR